MDQRTTAPSARGACRVWLAFGVALALGAGSFAALVAPADARPARAKETAEQALKRKQAAAVAAYDRALTRFKAVLAERRAQIDAKKKLPRLPGQAIYVARMKVLSTYTDLTEIMPERIGRANKYGMPPAQFDADIEPLIEEYAELFSIMQAPPTDAQPSDTPFEDVIDISRAVAKAKGLDAPMAEAAARISLGLFFAETGGNQNIGNARSNKYKGSLQTSVGEDRKGARRWAAIKSEIKARDPDIAARDDREELRVGKGEQRFNHWTAVRNGIMASHAELFSELPAIARELPDEIDQMKLFELIQIIPTPTLAAIRSGNILEQKVTSRQVMGFLRNNSTFTSSQADRAKTSATYREILDGMWLFARKFEKARTKYQEIAAARERQTLNASPEPDAGPGPERK